MPMGEKTKQLWLDPEYRARMSAAHKGKIHAGSFKKGHEIKNTGRTWFKKGHGVGETNYFYGKRFFGEEHPSWKGDDVGYEGIHSWLRREFGRAKRCQNEACTKEGRQVFHWANLTGIYNRVLKNWAQLCATCHNRFDQGRVEIFIERI